jgi:hypothetical protein
MTLDLGKKIVLGTADPLCLGYLSLHSLAGTGKLKKQTQKVDLQCTDLSPVFQEQDTVEVQTYVGEDGRTALAAVLVNVAAAYTVHSSIAKEVLDFIVGHADSNFELLIVGLTGSKELLGREVFEVQISGSPSSMVAGFSAQPQANIFDGLLAAFTHLVQAMGIPCNCVLAQGSSGLYPEVKARVEQIARAAASKFSVDYKQSPLLEAARAHFSKDVDNDFPHMYI